MIARVRLSRPDAIDIVEMMNDPVLFGRWFEGRSWDGWRAVLKAAFALPMTRAERAFFQQVAERDPPRKRVKELWVIAGRRSGKDSIASLIAAHAAALFDPIAARTRPGERPLVAALAVDRDQSNVALSYTRAYFSECPPLSGMVQRETQSGFELNNGVDIAVLTNDFRAVRGRTLLCAILDEIAFETSSRPDTETYRALKPGLATLRNSLLIGITSAYRRAGLAYQKWKKHYGRDDPDVLVIKAETRKLNPSFDQQVIDAALDDDSQAASAEYMSEWRDDLSSYVSRTLIEAAVDPGITLRPPQSGVR